MSVNDYDAELWDLIDDLVAKGELDKAAPAFGISQQVIYSGYNSLTPKQRTLYDAVVVPALERHGREIEGIHVANTMAQGD